MPVWTTVHREPPAGGRSRTASDRPALAGRRSRTGSVFSTVDAVPDRRCPLTGWRGGRASSAAPLDRSVARRADRRHEPKELADVVRLLDRVSKRPFLVDLVVIPPADPGTRHVALPDQVGHDRLGRPLGDPDAGGDVPAADPRIGSDAHEHVAMVSEECPLLSTAMRWPFSGIHH